MTDHILDKGKDDEELIFTIKLSAAHYRALFLALGIASGAAYKQNAPDLAKSIYNLASFIHFQIQQEENISHVN